MYAVHAAPHGCLSAGREPSTSASQPMCPGVRCSENRCSSSLPLPPAVSCGCQELGPWLPSSSSEGEVCEWCAAEGVDEHHHGDPYPLRASDLACWPTLDVDECRCLEAAFGNRGDSDQPTAALTEIAPLSAGHDILRVNGRNT